MNPAEGPYPMYAGAPPDRAQRTLREVLDEAKLLIFRDGGMDDEEYLALGDFYTECMTMAQAGGMNMPNPQATAGAGEQQQQQPGGPEAYGQPRGETQPLDMAS